MLEIAGKFNTAVCYTDSLEGTACAQIEAVGNEASFKDPEIHIMPYVHADKGCIIGTAMTVTDNPPHMEDTYV